ncbi:MAG: MerR family transcriptional regulator [Oscillospiraceae bacterium]|nr:MerR family transcriptional regulator [Oscillospiraceae bacterium]
MMTVREVSRLTGFSIRALRYYDEIGLLPPVRYTEAGYRLYDDAALERLQQILLFRELEFPLKEIKRILDSPAFDRNKALEQQIELLTLKREHIDNLIRMARTVKLTGGITMDFEAFDKKKLEEYAARARQAWGATPEYQEFEQKTAGKTPDEMQRTGDGLMALLAEFGPMKGGDPAAPEAQALARRVQDYITAHYYSCTKKIFAQLGRMYGSGGEFTENIDRAGGPGAAAFASEAIRIYCAE